MGSFHLLVTDEIDSDGVDLLRAEPSFIVDEIPTPKPDELLERIGDYDAFVGRSATRLPAEVLEQVLRFLDIFGKRNAG